MWRVTRDSRIIAVMTRHAAFLFDLDGTLVDSVYQHVLAWHEALDREGIPLSIWRVHRRIGMSGGLLINMLLRETGLELDPARIERIASWHAEAYLRRASDIRPLPGARELLAALTGAGIPWAIATSSRMETARPTLDLIGVVPERDPVVTRDEVRHAKPDPDLFLAAATRVGVAGGYGEEELERAGAYRVFADPAAMLNHLDELGVRSA